MQSYLKCDLSLVQCGESGVVVSQEGRAYLARGWTLSKEVLEVIDLAVSYGLNCMIQQNHPQKNGLLFDHDGVHNGRGRVYLSFSESYEDEWVFVLDDKSMQNGQLERAAINGKISRELIDTIPGAEPENRNKEREHVWVPIHQLDAALKLITKRKTPAQG